ncbi:MAG: iron ABC transporter permease [Propionicimonas sp.]
METAPAPTPAVGAGVHPRARRRRTAVVFLGLALLLVAAAIVAAMVGQVPVPPTEVIGSILRAGGIPNGWAPSDQITEATLWVVRFPRLLMAVVVGMALAVAGAVMQAVFGNPLAEPGVVGVSSGAALGAAIAIVLGVTVLGGWATAAFAFAGGFAAVLLVYLVSRSRGRTEVVTLILTGIAVNAFAGAGIAFLLFAADNASREQIVFWQLGSLNGSLGSEVAVVAAIAVPGTVAALWLAPRYDLLALGERNARHLGVNVEALRMVSIVLVALLTGAAVAFAGIIAFVGLVVPHILRMGIGPRHRPLLAGSALGGAALVVIADLLARTLVWGADLPIGMLTSLIGGPFFFFLLIRQRRAAGGWG